MKTDFSFYDLREDVPDTKILKTRPLLDDAFANSLWESALKGLRLRRERRARELRITVEEVIQLELNLAYGEVR